MALTGALQNALSGINANQEALRVTSNNIANVNTDAFSRSEVQQSARAVGGNGGGVFIESADRVVDQFLERAVLESESDLEAQAVQRRFLDQFQSLLGDPDSDSTITARLDSVFSALSTLSQNPTDNFARRDVVDKLNTFLGEISRVSGDVQDIRQTAHRRLGDAVDEANRLIRELRDLNPQLVAEKVQGSDATGLENRAAQLTSELSKLIDIQVETNGDNSLTIRTGSGTQLVGDTYAQLSVDQSSASNTDTLFPRVEIQRFNNRTDATLGPRQDFQANIRSGEISGLITLRDQILPNVSRDLGEFATQVRSEFNRVHNTFTSVPPPNRLEGRPTGLVGTNAANFSGIASFAVVDRTNNQLVDEFQLDFSSLPPGATLNDVISTVNTNLTDGTLSLTNGTLSFTAANANQGVVISQDATNPSQRGGQGFSAFFGMNDLVESASPGNFENGIAAADTHNDTTPGGGNITLRLVDSSGRVVTTGTVNTGTAGATYDDVFLDATSGFNSTGRLGAFGAFSISGSGQVVFTPNPGFEDLEVQVVSDTTNVAASGLTLTQFAGVGDAARELAARDMKVTDRIENNLNNLSVAQFTQGGAAGDVVLTGGDQRGARALEDLSTTQITFSAAGSQPSRATTLSNYSSNVLARAGSLAAQAENRETDAQALLTELSLRRDDTSGVNMEEELANLVTFQNSFNASARVLQSVQQAFDELLSVV